MSIEAEINWKGSKVKVVLGKLSYGKHNEVKKQATKIKIIGNSVQTSLDPYIYNELMILESLRAGGKCPFELTLNNIRELDEEDGTKLQTLVEKLHSLNKEKKQELDK